MSAEREIDVLAVYAHGAASAIHLLGIAYNIRRRQWFDTTCHTLAFIYDAWATYQHAKEL